MNGNRALSAEELAWAAEDEERAREETYSLRKAFKALNTRDREKADAVVATGMMSGSVPGKVMDALRAIGDGKDPDNVDEAREILIARLAELAPRARFEREEEEEQEQLEEQLEEQEPEPEPHPLLALRPDGITVTADESASHAAHALAHGAVVDAGELAARLAAAPDESARNRIALDPAMLRAAAVMELAGDAFALAELRRVVKAHKVSAKAWDAGVRDALDAIRDEGERAAAEQERAMREAEQRAREAREAEQRAALEAARRAAGEDRAPYVDTFKAAGGITFAMEPGSMTATVPTENRDGTPGRPKRSHLLNAAARILSVVEEQEQPDAPPVGWFRVGFATREGAPFAVDVPVANFNALGWITTLTNGRVTLSPGREVPDLVRVAINATREGAMTTTRRAFLGWVRESGRWMRVHAAGAIDAGGTVAGAAVRVTDAKLQRYAQPEVPSGEDRIDALDALRELVTLEPASAVLPVVAFVVRAMIGPGAGVCHVHGSANTGKSHLAALALCLSGEGFEGPRSLPGEWERDTVGFTAKVLSLAGDTPWAVDDWRPQWDPSGAKFHEVARATFNGSGRGALNRARGFNATPEPRGSVLSTGEALPSGGSWSGLSRVLLVALPARVTLPGGSYAPAPDDEEPERAFTVRAPRHLARAGSLLVQWLAARLDAWRDPDAPASRKRLAGAERAALGRWGVKVSERAVDVIGPVALGAEVLGAFLRDSGAMDARALAALEDRTRAALAALAGDRQETLAALAPGKAWCEVLGGMLRAGKAHAVVVKGNRTTTEKPEAGEILGWRYRNGSWEPQGPTVAHLDGRHPGALCVDPVAALGAVAEELRRRGRAPEVEGVEHLSRELAAAELLAARESAKRATVRTRVNGAEFRRLAVKLAAFGFESAPGFESTPDDTATDPDEG